MQAKRSEAKFLLDGRFGKNLGHWIKLASRGQNSKIRVSFKRESKTQEDVLADLDEVKI